LGFTSSAQKLYLTIKGNTDIETKTIDSLSYNQQHTNTKSIISEINSVSNQLIKMGFLETEVFQNKKENDTTFNYQFNLGQRINFIHIYIGNKKS